MKLWEKNFSNEDESIWYDSNTWLEKIKHYIKIYFEKNETEINPVW